MNYLTVWLVGSFQSITVLDGICTKYKISVCNIDAVFFFNVRCVWVTRERLTWVWDVTCFRGQGRVWKAVMEQHLRAFHNYCEPEFYKRLFTVASQPHISPSAKQVTCFSYYWCASCIIVPVVPVYHEGIWRSGGVVPFIRYLGMWWRWTASFIPWLLYSWWNFPWYPLTLRYKPEDRVFNSRWCHWNFSLT